MLFRPSPRHHAEPIFMKKPSRIDDINKGRVCVLAATNAIMKTSMYLEQTRATILSWHSAYVLFISLITLLVASSFADVQCQRILQYTIHVAIQTLISSTCGSSQSKSLYLEFTQVCRYSPDERDLANEDFAGSIHSAEDAV